MGGSKEWARMLVTYKKDQRCLAEIIQSSKFNFWCYCSRNCCFSDLLRGVLLLFSLSLPFWELFSTLGDEIYDSCGRTFVFAVLSLWLLILSPLQLDVSMSCGCWFSICFWSILHICFIFNMYAKPLNIKLIFQVDTDKLSTKCIMYYII